MLEDLQPIDRVFPCAVRTMWESFEPNDQAIFLKAINDLDAWSNKGLERALKARGLSLSETPIRKHRVGKCSCPVGWPHA
jgi:hypothetical protein